MLTLLMIISAPDAPTVTSLWFDPPMNTALAATPEADAVADQVPFLEIAPAVGEPKAVAGRVIVAKTTSAEVLISSVPELNRFPKAVARAFRVAVLCIILWLV
jgi:hypothetical protein